MSTLQIIRDKYREALVLDEDRLHAIDAACCVLAGHHVQAFRTTNTDPLWLLLVGPPSCGKTEIIRAFDQWPTHVYPLDTLTPHSLVSGYNEDGSDPSILKHVNGKVITLKDFTAQTSQDPRKLLETMGNLRTAYDGQLRKAFGTVGTRGGECDFAIIGCTTPAIYDVAEVTQELGERFPIIRIGRRVPTLREKAMASLTVRSRKDKSTWRKEVKAVVSTELQALFDKLNTTDGWEPPWPDLPRLTRIHEVAAIVSTLRTASHVTHFAESEGNFRLAYQLEKLATTRAVLDGRTEVSDEDVDFAVRVAHDTLPPFLAHVASHLLVAEMGISEISRLPIVKKAEWEYWVTRIRQWQYLGVIEPVPGPPEGRFRLSEELKELSSTTGFFDPLVYPHLRKR